MSSLIQGIQAHLGELVLILFSVIAVLLVSVALLVRSVVQTNRRWSNLLKGSDGRSIERLLQEHLRSHVTNAQEIEDLKVSVGALSKRMDTAKRFVGMVHYDAFENVGGNQSFSLAIYDDRGDGFVISCLYGRADCRVYSKLLENGKPESSITQEESKAIELAGNRGIAARVR